MKFNREIEAFIKKFVADLAERNVAIFAGAGMSKAAGYVNWIELLQDIADELGLKVDENTNLISLAQFHQNERGGRHGINTKILHEFATKAEPTPNHEILARLPITTFWTTNYDSLIEDSLWEAKRVPDVKHLPEQLNTTWPKRDAVVYKMHGDKTNPARAVITKQDFETYQKSREHFLTALSGDLVSKTFLFIGISFTDPNLDYVLSRLNIQFGENGRDHYCFVKRYSKRSDEDDEIYRYNLRKQELMINDLKRYKIQSLLIDDFSEITTVLREIELRFRKRTVFISGSAEEYGSWSRNDAQGFIHLLSKSIILTGYRIVNGFGLGVGSAVINGALEAVYERPDRNSEEQLVIKPFPQFKTGDKSLADLWEEYRQRMISLAGISIIIFGNKKDDTGKIVPANGVRREFEIATQHGLVPIPIALTGSTAKEIYDEIMRDPKKYYPGLDSIVPLIKELDTSTLAIEEVIKKTIHIIQQINK